MKKLILVLLALSLAAINAQAGVKIAHWLAPSGAKVYFVETHDLPILDVQVDFPAGAAFDPAGKSGVASLAQGLLDSGAGDLDEEQLAVRIADLGAQISGNVDEDRAGLGLRSLSSPREREAALALMQLILTQPTYPETAVAREKARSIAALQEGGNASRRDRSQALRCGDLPRPSLRRVARHGVRRRHHPRRPAGLPPHALRCRSRRGLDHRAMSRAARPKPLRND
jgi:hypothetical protein